MQSHHEFRTVYGLGGIRDIQAEWNAVVATMSQPRHVHQFAWFDAYARYLVDRPAALRVAIAYRRGAPVGVFPLARRTRMIGVVSARSLEIPQYSHLHLCDFVFERRPENSALVVALLDYLRDEPDPWDVVVAPSVLEDSAALFSISARRPRFLHIEETSASQRSGTATQSDARLMSFYRALLERGDVDAVNQIAGFPWQHHSRPHVQKRFTAFAFNHTLRGSMSFRMLRAKNRFRPTYQRYLKPLFISRALGRSKPNDQPALDAH